MFGTYYCPGPCAAPLGFQDNPGEHFHKLLAYPFIAWWQMLRPDLETGARETEISPNRGDLVTPT